MSGHHPANEGDKLCLAPLVERHFQFLHLRDSAGLMQPGQEQRSGMFAMAAGAHGAGTVARDNALLPQGHLHEIGRGTGTETASLECSPLEARGDDMTAPVVSSTTVE